MGDLRMNSDRRRRIALPVLAAFLIAATLLAFGHNRISLAFPTSARTSFGRLTASLSHIGIAQAATADPIKACPTSSTTIPTAPQDLIIDKTCTIAGGPGGAGNAKHYYYGNINVIAGGTLDFQDAQIDFWAKSIIVENGGTLKAGAQGTPIGASNKGPLSTSRSVVAINLWGPEQTPRDKGAGVPCQSPVIKAPADHPKWVDSPCGIPVKFWNDNDKVPATKLDNGVTDWFYKYDTMPDDGTDKNAYFGYKVLALSYGGTLQLYGKKGANPSVVAPAGLTGTSWVRLKGNLNAGDPTVVVDGNVTGSWQAGDDIVVTTTDYLPGHSEKLKIKSVAAFDTTKKTTTITLDTTNGAKVKWPHNGSSYSLTTPVDVKTKLGLDFAAVETRAAVGLLSRSIVIQSAGISITPDNIVAGINEPFPAESTKYFFGGHVVIRQGFQTAALQAVEFHQMGQGGKLGHYPIHFHMARKVPPDRTFVADCSVNESMTRWIVIHSTQGVSLLRNVGYLSIGHGYYLEDGTETDNIFYSNLGIFARAAVINAQNPRQVPGILAANTNAGDDFPYLSDWNHPVVFWITNGWNDFEYNMAAGAGTCGACYWLVPAWNSNVSQMMRWTGYASLQVKKDNAATTPLMKFLGNSCTSAMNSFQTIGSTAACQGVGANLVNPLLDPLVPVTNDIVKPKSDAFYYPNVLVSGGRFATQCTTPNGDCSGVKRCDGTVVNNCMVTVLDHYTTSFSWADTNLGAVWLRPEWYLVRESAITDPLNGGLTFVTGGGFTKSDAVLGYWALAQKSVFIGNTQKASFSKFSLNDGPFDPSSPLKCDGKDPVNPPGGVCLSVAEGIAMPLSNFAVNQRLFNIYDGPSYQDANAYLDIAPTILEGCNPDDPPPMGGPVCVKNWMQGRALGVPRDRGRDKAKQCYLPNAAIAWKQPNGFYYPPAFHSNKLFFNNVDIRHFVIEPSFDETTYITNATDVPKNYCTYALPAFNNDKVLVNAGSFDGYTDIDRQTELNDDDGSLTGLKDTISVNLDPFFNAPTETDECASDISPSITTQAESATAKTSPYDYATTVIWPSCAQSKTCGQIHTDPEGPNEGKGGVWSKNCGGPFCYGVPLYREFKTKKEKDAGTKAQFIRMAGQNTFQRSTLTVNNGTYYIDTTVPQSRQKSEKYYLPETIGAPRSVNVFQKSNTYFVFDVFAKSTTKQIFQLYVGKDFKKERDLKMVRANLDSEPYVMNTSDFPDTKWSKDFDPSTGLLTVTMDMTKLADSFNPEKSGLCQPHSFCDWKGMGAARACTCQVKATDPLALNNPGFLQDCQSACSNWATKDLDCPVGGCFGFAVTLPATFNIDTPPSPDPKPAPKCFPQDIKTFNVKFNRATPAVAGDCNYPNPLPDPLFCTD